MCVGLAMLFEIDLAAEISALAPAEVKAPAFSIERKEGQGNPAMARERPVPAPARREDVRGTARPIGSERDVQLAGNTEQLFHRLCSAASGRVSVRFDVQKSQNLRDVRTVLMPAGQRRHVVRSGHKQRKEQHVMPDREQKPIPTIRVPFALAVSSGESSVK